MSEYIIECDYDFDEGWIPGEHREEIVRCRDCAHFDTDEFGGYCTLFDFEDFMGMENRFCAWGKCEMNNKTGDFVTHYSRVERMCKMRADGAHCMNGVEFYECRSCGEYACIPTVMGKSEPPNYCPNCGAKVVGE